MRIGEDAVYLGQRTAGDGRLRASDCRGLRMILPAWWGWMRSTLPGFVETFASLLWPPCADRHVGSPGPALRARTGFHRSAALAGILSLSSLGLVAKILPDGHLREPIGLKMFTIVTIAEVIALLVLGSASASTMTSRR